MTTEYFLLARWQALTVAVGVVVVAGGAGLALAAPEVAAAGALPRHGVAAAVRGGGALQRALARLAAGVAPPAEQTNIRITHPHKKGPVIENYTRHRTSFSMVIYQAEHNLWYPVNVGWENFAQLQKFQVK